MATQTNPQPKLSPAQKAALSLLSVGKVTKPSRKQPYERLAALGLCRHYPGAGSYVISAAGRKLAKAG